MRNYLLLRSVPLQFSFVCCGLCSVVRFRSDVLGFFFSSLCPRKCVEVLEAVVAVAWLFLARYGPMGFVFGVLLRLLAEGLLLVGSVPFSAICSSLLSLLRHSWWVIGAVPWVVLVLRSWRAFSFRSPPLLSSTSRGCMPFPVCRGKCSGGGVRVSPPQGAVRPVSSSPGLFAAVWSSPRRQICGFFFFFLLEPVVGSVILSIGVAQVFFLHFVFRRVCLSLVLRVLFRSILLLVLACLRLRMGSFACWHLCRFFSSISFGIFVCGFCWAGDQFFSFCVKESCFWRRLLTHSDLRTLLSDVVALWDESGFCFGLCLVRI